MKTLNILILMVFTYLSQYLNKLNSHDLLWLWECGFKYDGNVFDTMLGEYILQRGQKEPLSLEACAER